MASGRGGKREGAGRPALDPTEKAKPFSAKLPPETHKLIKEKSEALGISQGRLVALAVEAYEVTLPEST